MSLNNKSCNIKTKELINGEILVLTNRYGGSEFSIGSPHLLIKKDNKYGIGEIYCGSEDSPHPLETKYKREFECNLLSNFYWFNDPIQFLWLMKIDPYKLSSLFDWDEDCDVDDFQEEVIKNFK